MVRRKLLLAGSSPLARGLRAVEGLGRPYRGIIPARAGFTRWREWQGGFGGDHPRSRGVYLRSGWPAPMRAGSSPLARGLPGEDVHPCAPMRIIPARAGFTGAGRQCAFAPRDHPRSRGVYVRAIRHRRDLNRIIPARAGFTNLHFKVLSGNGDHPRSRGVYPMLYPCTRPFPGSSPLARGLRDSERGHSAPRGIIPARAGFT